MKRRNAQILSILLSLCVLGTSPVYAEDFSSDTITTEAESQDMASDVAVSDAELSVEEDKDPATDGDPAADKDLATDKEPATDADVTLEEEENGNQEETNSDEFVDDQEETFSDGDSETEFDEEEEDVQNVAGPLTENEEDAVGSGTLLEADIPASDSVKTSCNFYTGMNLEAQNYSVWSSTVKSYLTQSPDGGLMRVQAGAIDSQTLLIEYYDKQYNLQKTMTLQLSLPIFGAFYEDDSNYYILTGANNQDKDNTKEVYRLTKYSKDWKAQGSCGLFGANTTLPFRAGSARMARYGNYIFVRTCHQMYNGHQANVTFSVNLTDMSVVDKFTDVWNWNNGYVSHSFNQFIQIDNGTLLGSDHGDGYPRTIAVLKYPTDISEGKFAPPKLFGPTCKLYGMVAMDGSESNYTGFSQGGFEYSDSSYLVAGNSDTNGEDSARNVFISSIPKDGGTATVRYFSDYAGTEDSAATPQLVKTGSNSFVLMWSSRGYVYYTAVNGSGQQIGSTHKMAGNLSDCVPTIADGKLIWYGWRNENTVFYDISLSDLSVNHAVRIQNGHRYKYGTVAADGHVDKTCSVCGDTEQLAVPTSVNYTFLFLDKAYVHMRDSMFLKSGNEYRLMWDYKFKNTSLKKISDLKITSSDPSVLQVEYSGSEWAWIKALKSGKVTLTVQDKYNSEAKCSSEIYVDILEEPAVYVSFFDTYANYDGTEHSVDVNVYSDMFKITKGTDYQVTYDGDRVNAGTVKVTVTGIGKYSGTTTGKMVINPVNVRNSQVSASIAADKYQYDGKEKKPGMVMSYQGMSLKEGKDYTLSYSNNVQPGTATVTVTGIGNYTGTLYRSFSIEGKPSEPVINPTKPSQETVTNPAAKPSSTTKVTPKPTVKPKPTATPKPKATSKPKAVKAPANTSSLSVKSKAKGKATVSWKAVKGITSYQVQYSNYKNMKKAKTVTLKSSSKSTTLKKLKRKKYCYVRIRTVKKVGKKNYYSKWSKVRSAKIK